MKEKSEPMKRRWEWAVLVDGNKEELGGLMEEGGGPLVGAEAVIGEEAMSVGGGPMALPYCVVTGKGVVLLRAIEMRHNHQGQ